MRRHPDPQRRQQQQGNADDVIATTSTDQTNGDHGGGAAPAPPPPPPAAAAVMMPPSHSNFERGRKRRVPGSGGSGSKLVGHSAWDHPPPRRGGGRHWDETRRRYGHGYKYYGLQPNVIVGFFVLAGSVLSVVHVILLRSAYSNSSANTANGADGGYGGDAGIGTATGTLFSQTKTGVRGGAAATNGSPKSPDVIIDPADLELLSDAKSHVLTPLGPTDRERYTVRINTWRRNEQLLVSLNHHSQCDGVALIQVVWCDADNDPPSEVVNHVSGKVVVERHDVNSLNERFHILATTEMPTLGVLSMDDDVLRPCDATDAGFFRWTKHPDRIVGYDARLHVPNVETHKFEYGYLSSTEKYNLYSMTLPRYCFLHRDYLDLYMSNLPRPIFTTVETKFNCEDIAMSLFVTALTHGKPPLLADFWATKTQVKLYVPSSHTISASTGHHTTRNQCVNDFMVMLGLMEDKDTQDGHTDDSDDHLRPARLKFHQLWHETNIMFGYGAEPDDDPFAGPREGMVPRHAELAAKIATWSQLSTDKVKEKIVGDYVKAASREAVTRGLVEKTTEWKERWDSAKKS